MTHIKPSHKSNNNISTQVSEILSSKGLSKIFNYQDYRYFKNQVNSAFNVAQAIAEKFIEYYEGEDSDFNEYVF
jgi:hypothetical protein